MSFKENDRSSPWHPHPAFYHTQEASQTFPKKPATDATAYAGARMFSQAFDGIKKQEALYSNLTPSASPFIPASNKPACEGHWAGQPQGPWIHPPPPPHPAPPMGCVPMHHPPMPQQYSQQYPRYGGQQQQPSPWFAPAFFPGPAPPAGPPPMYNQYQAAREPVDSWESHVSSQPPTHLQGNPQTAAPAAKPEVSQFESILLQLLPNLELELEPSFETIIPDNSNASPLPQVPPPDADAPHKRCHQEEVTKPPTTTATDDGTVNGTDSPKYVAPHRRSSLDSTPAAAVEPSPQVQTPVNEEAYPTLSAAANTPKGTAKKRRPGPPPGFAPSPPTSNTIPKSDSGTTPEFGPKSGGSRVQHKVLTLSDEVKEAVARADRGSRHAMSDALMDLSETRLFDQLLFDIAMVFTAREVPHKECVTFFSRIQGHVAQGRVRDVARELIEWSRLPVVHHAVKHLHV